MKVGIDFGTTNSSVAWFNPQKNRVENILFDNGDARVPSLVYWDNEPSKRRFGYDADMASRDAEEDSNIDKRVEFQHHLAKSFKTDFAINRPIKSLNMGERISPDVVVKEYLSWLMKEIREKTHTPEHEQISATLTYPTTVEWDSKSGPAYRLQRIAEEVGFVNVQMMREPEAAFREARRRKIVLGTGVLVFDLGGGTLDLVYYRQDVNGEFNRPFVPGEGKAGIAGDAFDNVMLGLLDVQVHRDSNNALNIGHVVAAKRRARYAKEELSQRDEVSVAMATNNMQCPRVSARISREVFERKANHTFEQIKNELTLYVRRIKNQNAPLDTVLLVGGSTNIPKVCEIIKKVITDEGYLHVTYLHPPVADFLVSLGAVARNEKPDAPTPDERTDVINPMPATVDVIGDPMKYLDDLCEHVSKTFSKLTSYSKWRGRLYAIGVPCDPRANLLTLPGVPLWKLYASASFDTKRLYNAKESMGLVSKENETGIVEVCLVQGDSTICGGGREGFLCTARGFYMKLDDNAEKFAEWGKDLTFHVRDNGFYVKKSGSILGSADMHWQTFQLNELVMGLKNLCAWITENRTTH